MARRSEHSQEEIKEMVLKAAEVIVIDEGFAELKVRKVAMEIGYTVGSIYMVFDNMADLIMHVKGRTLDDIAEYLESVVNEENAEQSIAQLAKAYLAFASKNFNRWRMIFEHQLVEDEVVPDWYQQKVDHVFALVEKQFKQLPTSHTEEQSKLAARALWSGVHGVCVLSLTGKLNVVGASNIENTLVLLVENFMNGWRGM